MTCANNSNLHIITSCTVCKISRIICQIFGVDSGRGPCLQRTCSE